MSKFAVNDRRRIAGAATSPVTSTGPAGVTHEGATGFGRDAKSELFLLAVSNLVAESTFYEAAGERDERYRSLVAAVAATDPGWLARFVPWLRGTANMRSASVVAALEGAHALLELRRQHAAVDPGVSVRSLVDSALQRPDELGEALAYWRLRFGRRIPIGVKRGVADATVRLVGERSALRYDGAGKAWRLGDVLEVVHPTPKAPWQSDLFAYLLDRRHHPDEVRVSLERLPMIRARRVLEAMPVEHRRALVEGGSVVDTLEQAGASWEWLAGWLQGPMDEAAWRAAIPGMGYMALLRNLRNFDEAGVSDAVAARVAAKLADPAEVARSKQFPMRFLSAYRAAPSLRWAYALEVALTHSLSNVPELPGRTLVLVDRSGSMFDRQSDRSQLTRADAAAVFGSALAVRNHGRADLVQFGSTSQLVTVEPGASLLRVVQRFGNLGGTDTRDAVRRWYAGHDRVVIVTDEQASTYGEHPTSFVPAHVPVYTWNLAGYRLGHGPSGTGNRHTFGGLTDAAFTMIPLLEAAQSASWPF